MGFDHELSKEEEQLMEAWEEKALKKFAKIKK
jgi:ssRNA-specific RNase YbeY (16S rRNA maturation enzyme)